MPRTTLLTVARWIAVVGITLAILGCKREAAPNPAAAPDPVARLKEISTQMRRLAEEQTDPFPVLLVPSKPVTKDGLSVTVTLPKAMFAADEPLKFTVQFKNVTEKPFALYDVEWFWDWSIRFEDLATKGPWQLRLGAKVEREAVSPRTCKPGETVEVTVDLGKGGLPFDFTWEGLQKKPVPPLKQLHPGKYRLTIDIPLKEGPVRQDVAFWTGTIKSEPVEFEISDKPAAAKP